MANRYEDIFKTLIGFDTTSRDSNLHLIHWVRDYLKDLGIESHLIHNDEKTKANLFATIGGGGEGGEGGIALSGHTDVVPIDGQDWSTDAFSLQKSDDRYFGRGTCDMKGFIAVALSFVPEMLAKPLKTPLHFAFSFDEEVGCLGAPKMIAEFGKKLIQPKIVIVGEPSDMHVVSGHKGMSHYRTIVKGLPRHSSQTHMGVSAIFYAGQLLEELRKIAEKLASGAGEGGEGCGYEPPHSTISSGIISGGSAENIIPEFCEFYWETRNLPSDIPADYLRSFFELQDRLNLEMQVIDKSCGIETTGTFSNAFCDDLGSPAEVLVRALTGDNDVRYVSYCTESGQFQEAGCSVVICGPGSIDQAHRPDEFVMIQQMDKCVNFLEKLIDYCRANQI